MIDKLNFTAQGGFEVFVENTCRFDNTQIFYAFRFSVHLYELLQARGVLDVPAKLNLEINLKNILLRSQLRLKHCRRSWYFINRSIVIYIKRMI